MPLTPGERLGPYEILASIGAGGMGEVFKARDTRLGRIVAIKTANARFTERFGREARAVAALSHPNICTLYDVGPDYLVMEFIDGKPLKGPMPVEIALRYAREIASALYAAHRLNIIHRDLKPANILVTKAGIKLLDFGLAKMTTATPIPDETVTTLTEEGVILGTLHYMSPEQLEGKETDARSDIFSFGCVLYEMLTGRMAFQGESKASIIAAIMDREPQPLADAPPALAGAIYRCMAKDPDDRWQSARDLAGVLDLAAAVPVAGATPARPRAVWPALTALALVALLAVAAAFWFAQHRPKETRWSGNTLGGPAEAFGPRVSPDGNTIAFQAMVEGQTQVAILKPESGNWTVLTRQTSLGQINDLAWSRDGAKIYFDRDTDTPLGVYSVPVLGGEPRLVLEQAGYPQVLADGTLSVIRINSHGDLQVHRFWPDSGKVEPLPAITAVYASTPVRAMPGGNQIVFYGRKADSTGDRRERGLYVMNLDGSHLHQLAPGVVLPVTELSSQNVIAFAGAPGGRNLVVSVPAGSLHHFLEVPLDGGDSVHTLLTSTLPSWSVDVAQDGSIIADQIWMGQTILRFPASGGQPARLTGAYPHLGLILVLPDGRPLVDAPSGDAQHLAIVEKNGTLSPLVENNEPCGPPAAMVGDRNVAVMTERQSEIAVVSVADGRIVARVQLKSHGVTSLAASRDGKTFFYVSDHFVWSVPTAGGDPVRLAPGDSISTDPNGRDLVIAQGGRDSVRLARISISGGDVHEIALPGDLRMPNPVLTSGAVSPDGRIVVEAVSASRWQFTVGIVDPRGGGFSAVPHAFDGEVGGPVWDAGGQIVAVGREYGFSLWRFRPSSH